MLFELDCKLLIIFTLELAQNLKSQVEFPCIVKISWDLNFVLIHMVCSDLNNKHESTTMISMWMDLKDSDDKLL
jgi:hypothetical protein